MRVVLDTNVLIRAIASPTGPAGECLRRISKAPHVLVPSQPMMREVERVLEYPRVSAKHKLPREEVVAMLALIGDVSHIVAIDETTLKSVISDKDDAVVIASVLVGNADVICTRDNHFYATAVVELCQRHGVRIMGDVQLLAELRAAD